MSWTICWITARKENQHGMVFESIILLINWTVANKNSESHFDTQKWNENKYFFLKLNFSLGTNYSCFTLKKMFIFVLFLCITIFIFNGSRFASIAKLFTIIFVFQVNVWSNSRARIWWQKFWFIHNIIHWFNAWEIY